MQAKIIHVVRHAQAEHNVSHAAEFKRDTRLTPHGRTQLAPAKAIVRSLLQQPEVSRSALSGGATAGGSMSYTRGEELSAELSAIFAGSRSYRRSELLAGSEWARCASAARRRGRRIWSAAALNGRTRRPA